MTERDFLGILKICPEAFYPRINAIVMLASGQIFRIQCNAHSTSWELFTPTIIQHH